MYGRVIMIVLRIPARPATRGIPAGIPCFLFAAESYSWESEDAPHEAAEAPRTACRNEDEQGEGGADERF